MKIHFIAIGGSAMHNLAIALHKKGYKVTGSDDAIFSPSKERLLEHNLLPQEIGWNKKNITADLDQVILGMHAKEDNIELLEAKKLKIPIYSYPEYIYLQSKNKKRIVIGGSHGKTTITAMILHVLKKTKFNFDYMVGAQLQGFDTMVKITKKNSLIILEGDEYLSSAIDRRPKFHLYKPHIAVISGISWDHINVFPSFKNYIEQFRIFKNTVIDKLIYFKEDIELQKLMNEKINCEKVGYSTPPHTVKNGVTIINKTKLKVFGDHNLQNLNAARLVCNDLGISDKVFLKNISSFEGASKRMELLKSNNNRAIYKDFAHSPSKLKATISALKKQFTNRKLIACLELHTFSSLNLNFLSEYKDTMQNADIAVIYVNPKNVVNKRLKPITKEQLEISFNRKDIKFFTDSSKLEKELKKIKWADKNLLMMSSGNFNNIKLSQIF
tara:strand:- start:194 stop:1516 length:1323 start_codon:yes stop_codon:yes gene_type:complete